MIKRLSILAFLLIALTSANLYLTSNYLGNSTAQDDENEDFQLASKEYAQLSPAAGTAQVGGGFSLINQDGAAVKDADFRGKVMVVFFGFTSCPDICPVTTATLAKTIPLLGDKAKDAALIFISIDPEHDTPKILKKYLANFDKSIVGLTGTKKQVDAAVSAYKAFASKDGKNINHSGFIYIMDKKGLYSQHFAYNASAEEIAAAIKKLLD